MYKAACFLCLIIVVSLPVSHFLGKGAFEFLWVTIAMWLVLDKIFARDTVERQRSDRLASLNQKLQEENLLLHLNLRRAEADNTRRKSLKGSSCKF